MNRSPDSEHQLQQHRDQAEEHSGGDVGGQDGALDRATELAAGEIGNGILGHGGSSIGIVGRAGSAGQILRFPKKIATNELAARRRAATALLRIREATGLSQDKTMAAFGVPKRTLGALERGECRMTALELFLRMVDHVAEKHGIEAVLDAVLPDRAQPGRKKAA